MNIQDQTLQIFEFPFHIRKPPNSFFSINLLINVFNNIHITRDKFPKMVSRLNVRDPF